MEIYINNKQLHITKGDVTLNWANIRFSEAVADEWSTEIDLPNDKWNISQLECYGLLDRGAIYNHRIKCGVMVEDIAKDGYLQILSIDENTIKARVFVVSIPYAVLDKKVSDYYPQNDIIFRWDRFTPITRNIAGVDEGVIPYDYTSTDFYTNILAQWHPSVSVQKILSNIMDAEDITLPAVYNTLYQISSNKKVCPSNTIQVLQGYLIHNSNVTGQKLELHGGQHITNDYEGSWSYADFVWNNNYTDWNIDATNIKWLAESKGSDTITFNRQTNARIKVYVSGSYDLNDPVGTWVVPQKNDTDLCPQTQCVVRMYPQNWTENDLLVFDDTVTFNEGDTFSLSFTRNTYTGGEQTLYYTVVFNYSDYTWNDNDYNTELTYIPAPFLLRCMVNNNGNISPDYKYDFSGTGDGTHSPTDYSFTYFGAYSNLNRDITVRDYLTSLCWIHNQKLRLDRDELIFQSANTRESITANITQISPASDKLGQTNKIGYRDSQTPTEFTIDNEFIEPEKVLHENTFFTADVIPQYNYEMTYSEEENPEGENWITDINVNFEEVGAVIMTAIADYQNNAYTLKRAPQIQGFGLPAMRNAQTITAVTLEDISSVDYIIIDGHKYMVVGGQTDLNTYITEFTAIQCDSVFNLIPVVVINQITTTGTTADVNFTVTGIFIQDTILTVYADNGHSQIVWQQHGTNEDTQTMTVTGLRPDTFYWATVTATDAQGNEGESQTRQFKTAIYEFTGTVSYTGDYDTLHATVQVTCNGATFTETGIEFSTSPDFEGDVISANNTTAPADTFNGNVSGFAENTLYYIRYYATSDFGTQYYTPTPNTITTRIAPPVLTITEVSSTPDTLTLSFLYSGLYPYDGYYSCMIGLADDSGQPIPVDLDNLQPNTPEIVTVENLRVGSEYFVSWDVNYYEDEVSAVEYFHTQAHNFNLQCVIDSITDTEVRMSEAATQITSDSLTLQNIGINLYTSPDFDGSDMGGNLGEGGLAYRMSVNNLNEHTTYYYRPWIQTAEYGVEYGETNSFTTLYSRPTVTITEVSHSYDTITVNVNYTGNYPVPTNGVLSLYLNGVELQRLDASRLRPNDNNIFTFANLDELTTYTITYTGDYYTEQGGITDTITATTGERINITLVTSWSPNGQCTQTIAITAYEAITNYNVVINGDNITMVDDWTLNGTTIEGVSQGYNFNENPYNLDLTLTIGGSYNVSRNFSFSVPTDDLRVTDTFGHMYPPYIKKQLNGTVFKRTGGRTQFLIDVQNTSLTLVERTTGYECFASCNGVNYQVDNLNNRLLTALQYYPAGEYRAKWTVTNIMGQTLTEFDRYNSNTIVYGAIFINVSKTADSIKFDVRWNMWGGYTQTKRVDLVLNGHIMESLTLTPNVDYNSNIQFTNLFAGMDYTIRAYYDTNSVTNYVDYYYTTPIDYLNFSMPNGGTVTLTKNGTPTEVTLQYSLDNGNTWTEWVETENVRSLTLAAGQTMHLRNTSDTSTGFSTWDTRYYNFSFSADTYAGGDLRTLLCKNHNNATSENRIFCFFGLFMNATNLISAKIKLLFTDLPRSFYRSMFQGCTNLIEVPETITATTASGVQPCYRMFYHCPNITKLPKLTLLQLTNYAYGNIAAGCTSLNYVYTEMIDISATGCISDWIYNVSPNGDFYCPAELTIPTGSSGVPNGWTRHNLF